MTSNPTLEKKYIELQTEHLKLQSLCVKLLDVYFDIARDKDGQQLYSVIKQIQKEVEPKP